MGDETPASVHTIAAVKRSLYPLYTSAAILAALWPVAAGATASPSPSLETILASPPAAYSTPVNGPYNGHLTAGQYGQSCGQDAARCTSELGNDGFVDGFGTMVADRATGRIMAEFVLAFSGQSGALRFLGADNQRNVSDAAFVHVDTHSGLGSYYYGVHMAQASPALVLDGFEFVKGNDMFGVAFYSVHDDVLALATAQAKAQYDDAPASTISSNDWPENQAPPNTGASLGDVSPTVLIAILALGVLLAGGVFLGMRRKESAAAGGGFAPVQPRMSEDGNFWWGGSSWVSINDVAPPWAQRSPDGAYWWDGRGWRPVPGAAQLTPR
jgi:hypothetical protein